MKKLVVFYSFEGNTRYIAGTIAETIGADTLELKPVEEPANHGFMKFFWGGKQVIKKEKPQLEPLSVNPLEYDVIFVGTPVWAWSHTPALSTFFAEYPLKDKNIALFCCHGGGKGKVFDKMREALGENNFIGEIDFVEPLKKDKSACAARAKEWAQSILQQLPAD
jgi:flavodoxin